MLAVAGLALEGSIIVTAAAFPLVAERRTVGLLVGCTLIVAASCVKALILVMLLAHAGR